jgi:predicted component of viral defense system (DUF524 family)
VEIFAPQAIGAAPDESPLVVIAPDEAVRFGEEIIQLRERSRYEYRLEPAQPELSDLRLLAARGVQPSLDPPGRGDRGLIEPEDHCGLLPLVVIHRSDPMERPVATGAVEVRSVKLDYRTHYRGMLTYIAEKCAGLLLDSRASIRLRLSALWQFDTRILEQQLEFLRSTVESTLFIAALNEVLRNPHRRLEEQREDRHISQPFKPDRKFAKQIALGTRRLPVPESHPLSQSIQSLPMSVTVRRRADYIDTAENRFAKMVLTEFRDFLAEVASHLTREGNAPRHPEVKRLLVESKRLQGLLEAQLARGFLPDVSPPSVLQLGSPILQRKTGYRELLRFWLQFHAGAQLAWDGGPEIYHAGGRDVATLYEYWLFFQLEALFREKFASRQPLHAIVVDRQRVPPQLVLKRGVQLKTPVEGSWSKTAGRNLRADFHFNRKFTARARRERAGSWTRGAQPDYTISMWPAEYSRDEAEEKELMVHVHFDAKYRVDRVNELLGDETDDIAFENEVETKEQARTAAKYTDLLKMHAYRDAIRRTAGAYVLYPGNPGDGRTYQGFHEVLPGLGAFAIRPDEEGRGQGLKGVSTFLDKVVEHLSNRTTARERVTFHQAGAYESTEAPVPYDLRLEEADRLYGNEYRAVPPAEHMVLVAWYRDPAQVDLARAENGIIFVRLGGRRGALHVQPNLSQVRHILLRSEDRSVASGLLVLRVPGFRIYTRAELRRILERKRARQVLEAWDRRPVGDEEQYLYALFETTEDPDWSQSQWNGEKVMDFIEQFESDRRNKPVVNLGRTSPDPRVLSLRELLKALSSGPVRSVSSQP